MKKIFSAILSLFLSVNLAYADACGTSLQPLFNAYQAAKLCKVFSTGSFSASLLPTVDNTYDLGSAAKQFRTGYLGTNLIFGAASAQIVPGATSLLFRNHANAATNLSITDAGLVTVGAGLTVSTSDITDTAGNLIFGAASAKVIPGATSLLFTNNANNQTNLSITDAGLVTARAGVTVTTSDVNVTAGNLIFGAASAKIIPGATSLLIQNNANNATNVSITDGGIVTLRNLFNSTGLQFPVGNYEAVAGAGTTVADAAALAASAHIHQITGANGTVGWKFSSPGSSSFEILLNTTAGVPKIYAETGGTINGAGANVAFSPATGVQVILCFCTASITWICA